MSGIDRVTTSRRWLNFHRPGELLQRYCSGYFPGVTSQRSDVVSAAHVITAAAANELAPAGIETLGTERAEEHGFFVA
jgi:hypothetical protein